MKHDHHYCLGATLPEDAFQHCGDKRIKLHSGGGGGGGSNYYKNMNKLYGVQSQAAQYMLDQAMPVLPGYMQNTQGMVDDAFSGKLEQQQRQKASADFGQSLGMATDSMNRNMARYGAEYNPNRMKSMSDSTALQGAVARTGVMNQASQYAEDQKWNRNANAFAQATGLGSGAMDSIGSAARGIGTMANGMMANQQANASGYGKFGASVASAFAKGGEVKAPKLASGGDAWSAFKKRNPVAIDGAPSGTGAPHPLLMIAAGAAPNLIAKGLKSAAGSDLVQSNVVKPAKDLADKATRALTGRDYKVEAPQVNEAMDLGPQAVDAYTSVAEPYAQALDFGPQTVVDSTVGAVDVITPQASDAVASSFASLFAKGGDAVASSFASLFAKGGEVKGPGLRMAMGGLASAIRMPSVAGMDASSSMRVSAKPMQIKAPAAAQSSSPAMASSAGLTAGDGARTVGQVSTAMDAADKAKTAGDAAEAAKTASDAINAGEKVATAGEAMDAASKAVELGDAASKAGDAANSAAGGNPVGAVVKGVVDIASGRDAGTAVADAGAAIAGAKAGAALGSIVPGVGNIVGGAIGGLLGGALFADGGDVQRADFRPGGKVTGPGTETSDSIPAWLSKGEVVNNAESVKMPHGEAKKVVSEWLKEEGSTKDLLLALNSKGLKRQGGKGIKVANPKGAKAIKVANPKGTKAIKLTNPKKDGVKLAGGGFLGGNLGVALGSAVDEMAKQRQVQRQDDADKRDAQFDRVRMQAAEQVMQKTALGIKQDQRKDADEEAVRAHLSRWQQGRKKILAGDFSDFEGELEAYNQNTGDYADGFRLVPQSTPNGKVFHHIDNTGAILQSYPAKPGEIAKLYDTGMSHRMRMLSPTRYDAAAKAAEEAAQKAADREVRLRVADVGAGARIYGADVRTGATVEAANIRARALENRPNRTAAPTLGQERGNAEIDAARSAVEGLDPEEIRRRTAPTTATGRVNDSFDPHLARAAKLSARRKVGNDEWFDTRHGNRSVLEHKPNPVNREEVARRFRSDPNMNKYTLGKETPKGIEVLEKGRVVGHYD